MKTFTIVVLTLICCYLMMLWKSEQVRANIWQKNFENLESRYYEVVDLQLREMGEHTEPPREIIGVKPHPCQFIKEQVDMELGL